MHFVGACKATTCYEYLYSPGKSGSNNTKKEKKEKITNKQT